MTPARIAAVESQPAREGGVTLTGYMTQPTWNHTLGSLMHVENLTVVYLHNLNTGCNVVYNF